MCKNTDTEEATNLRKNLDNILINAQKIVS